MSQTNPQNLNMEQLLQENDQLRQQVCTLTQQLTEELDKRKRAEDAVIRLEERCSFAEANYAMVTASRGYQLLKKYYAFAEKLKSGTLLKKSSTSPSKRKVLPQEDAFNLLRHCDRIDVMTVKHTAYVAELLQGILLENGIQSEVHIGEPAQYQNIPYIIICPQNFKHFPAMYIAFQMEQTINPRWMTEEYFAILRDAYAIFDYSLINIDFFSQDSTLASKLYYMPIDVCSSVLQKNDTTAQKEYDVLFYGDPSNDRRKHYLSRIAEQYKIRIVSEVFGDALYEEMKKAKIIVNIHYYQDALLETTRLYETLSVSDCIIVSERSGDPEEDTRLEGIVDFVDVDDVDAMLSRIGYWLNHDEERAQATAQRRRLVQSRANATKFFLNRFLLANDRITFDYFYHRSGDYIHFDNDRICLSLPESTVRRASFDRDNQYGFTVFPGLKHNTGWIGCGMSYKFMFRKALEQNMEQLLICEDDVYFPPDFAQRFQAVLDYTWQHRDWNVFSGILADLGSASVLDCCQEQEETFVYLDRMISMVFNLYDRSIFELIANWDERVRIHPDNTIDRYLEDKQLRVLTTSPFLVGHKEDLHSTLWNSQNTEYNERISNSAQMLKQLAADFQADHPNE